MKNVSGLKGKSTIFVNFHSKITKKGLSQTPSGGLFWKLWTMGNLIDMGLGMIPGDPQGIFGDKKKLKKISGMGDFFANSANFGLRGPNFFSRRSKFDSEQLLFYGSGPISQPFRS